MTITHIFLTQDTKTSRNERIWGDHSNEGQKLFVKLCICPRKSLCPGIILFVSRSLLPSITLDVPSLLFFTQISYLKTFHLLFSIFFHLENNYYVHHTYKNSRLKKHSEPSERLPKSRGRIVPCHTGSVYELIIRSSGTQNVDTGVVLRLVCKQFILFVFRFFIAEMEYICTYFMYQIKNWGQTHTNKVVGNEKYTYVVNKLNNYYLYYIDKRRVYNCFVRWNVFCCRKIYMLSWECHPVTPFDIFYRLTTNSVKFSDKSM